MNTSRISARKVANVFIGLVILEVVACYGVWLVFGIDCVVYPAFAFLLTMPLAAIAAVRADPEAPHERAEGGGE